MKCRFSLIVVGAVALVVAGIVTAQISSDSWKSAAALPQAKSGQPIMVKVSPEGNRGLTLRYRVPELIMSEIVQDSAYGKRTRLQLGNAPLRGNEGEPVLPVIPVQFIIPFGREIDEISVVGEKRIAIQLKSPLEYGSAPVALIPGYPAKKAIPKSEIYESDKVFPSKNNNLVTVQQKRGVSIGVVNLHPISYFPKYNRIEYCREFEIKITFRQAMKTDPKPLRLRSSIHELKKLGVENPEAIQEYRDSLRTSIPLQEPAEQQMLLDPSESYQYVVITSEAMRDASTDVTINDLISHRRAQGLTATLVTTESILADYSGVDNAEKVRNFIKDAYANWETEYVVLGGDVNIIPIRYLYTDGDQLPSDLYYQCLDGSFNSDGDTYWGEPEDGENGGDVDLFAEVYVGRISAENPEEMSNAVYKILAYEKDNESEEYLRSACLVGEELGPQFGPGEFGFAHPFMNEIRNGSSAAGYTTVGFVSCPAFTVDSLDDWDAYWPVDSLISRINDNKYSILNHLGHANTDYVMKMTSSQADNLSNTKYLFALSQGCFPGDMTSDCIAEHLTTSNRHGFFAGVFNSHYGWGAYNDSYENLDGPSQRINRQFWDAYFGEYLYNLGAINADSHEDNVWDINGDLIRWCVYETNLFGDPYTIIQGQTQGPKIVFKAADIDDRVGGNGDNIINPGEQIAVSLALRNIGNGAASSVSAVLTANDPYVIVNSGNLNFGDMPCCGVVTSSSNTASISITSDCPTPYSFPLTIEITDNSGNSWLETFTLVVHTSYTISGRVLTLTGSNPVPGAKVSVNGPVSGVVTTNDAGEYLFTGLEGTYIVRAEAVGYLPVEPVEVTLPPDAEGIDFLVSRPHIAVEPVSITHTLSVNDSVELPLEIINSGDADLNFSISAVDNTAPEALNAKKLYDATHFVKLKKGDKDHRIGKPVTLGYGGPDRFGYRWADSDEPGGPVYEWNDISTTGKLLTDVSNCDDCYQSQSLSFSLPFYGTEYSQIFIGSNGYCTFGEGSDQYWNVPLPSEEAPSNLVAAFFDDLYPAAGGEIYFQDFGAYAVIQFNNVAYFGTSGSVTFQIVISRNGTITYYYKTLTGPVNSMTAGIQNGSRDDGLTIVYNSSYLKNEFAIRLRPTPGWMSISPQDSTVLPGSSIQCMVKLSSIDLIGGEYTGTFNIFHNDPQRPGALSVPVSLIVDGFKSLTAEPSSVSFGNLWLGLKDTMTLTLWNTGTQSTIISGISSDNPAFVVDTTVPFKVRPGRSAAVRIIFTPQVLGPVSGTINIVSDAEDNPSITVTCSGVATPGPQAVLTPSEMVFNLGPKDVPADQTAVLANTGGDVLSYRVFIRQKSKPSFELGAGSSRSRKPIIENLIYSPYNYMNEFAPDRVIVALKEGKNELGDPSLLLKLGNGNVRELATAKIPKKGIRVYNGKKLILVPLANGSRDGVLEAIRLLRQDPNVAYAEPDYRVRAIGIPNDPLFALQYALHNTGQTGGTPDADIDAVEGWDMFTGENSDVIIGIIDTGIDYLHPDLAGNIWTNAGEIPGNGIDDDNNGFADDVYGWDFAYDDSDPMDVYGHGTHCSGIAAGRGNDGVGVCGVSWGARLMAVKFLDDGGSGWTSDAIDAVAYATAMGATITSNSWGGGGYDQSLYDVIAAGGLFVAAAGNNGSNADQYPMYPAAYDLDNIISVAATDHNDALASFSNWGPSSVDIGAPGVDILSCLPGNQHEAKSGTSMAAPHVSGCAALLLAYNPLATVAELKEAILKGVDVIPALEDRCVSGGRLNIVKALESITPPWISVAPMTPGTVETGQERQFTVTVNPAGLIAGTWCAEVVFATDDPFNPDHIITVTAEITPCRALNAGREELRFDTIWAGRDTTARLALVNECNAPVTVSSLSFDNPAFTSEQTLPFTVRPFGRFDLPVRFAPHEAGSYDGFATITSDAEDNPSLTVAVHGISVTPPIISVDPTSIERTLAYETTETVPVTLTNTGGADFLFKTKTLRPPRSAYNPKTSISDASLYAAFDDGFIRRIDPETGDFIGDSIKKPGYGSGPEGLAYDGEKLYYVFDTPDVIVIDPETGNITDTIKCKVDYGYGIDGLAVTDEYLVLNNYIYGFIYVCDKTTGDLVSKWDVSGFIGGIGASESRRSVFVANYYNSTIEERSILDGQLINSFNAKFGGMGVGFSEGANVLFVASPWPGDGILVLDPDDGTEIKTLYPKTWAYCWALAADEAGENTKWLSADIKEGTVPAGGTITLNAIFNSAQKLPLRYDAIIQIQHRRPFAPGPFDVGCSMTVLPEKRCSVSPALLSYNETWVGRTDTLQLYLVNTGNAETSVNSISSNNSQFTAFTATPLIIPPFDSVLVPVGFTPRRASTVTGRLTIRSDAVRSPTVTVSLQGVALNPPRISYSPNRITRTMLPNSEQQVTVNLRNTGGADYRFKVSIESVENSSGQAKLLGINGGGIYNLNPTTGELISLVSGEYPYGHCAFDGQYLFVFRDWSDSIEVMDPENGTIIRSFRLEGKGDSYPYEMGINDRYIFMLTYDYSDTAKGYTIKVCDKTDGTLRYSWQVDWSVEGLCNGKNAGTVYTYNYYNNTLETRKIETGEVINTVSVPEYGWTLTYSRALDVIYMSTNYEVTMVNPVTGEAICSFYLPDYMYIAADEAGGVSWLRPQVDSSAVVARGSCNLVFRLNTTRMLPGVYNANIKIAHHKGWTPGPFIIPCQLTVLPIKKMAVVPGSIDFGNVWIGKDSVQALWLKNDGNVSTKVFSIANLNRAFTFDPQAPITVGPFSSVKVNARFTPVNSRRVNDVAIVISDAIDLPVRTVRLAGCGVTPPAITVEPAEFTLQLPAGGSSQETLRLTNTGGAEYAFRINGFNRTPGSGNGPVLYASAGNMILQLDPATFEQIGNPIVPDPDNYIEGLAFDNRYLYIPNSYSEEGCLIYKIDPADATNVDTIHTEIGYGWISGLGVMEDMLIVMESNYNKIYFIDKNSGATIRSQDLYGGYGALTAAASRESFFIFNYYSWTIEERSIADGTLKNQLPVPEGIDYPTGAGFSVADSALFICDYYGNIVKIDPDNGAVISSAYTGMYDMYGLAADEAVTLPAWLSLSAKSGIVPPGGRVDIGVLFDASTTSPGSYFADIKITPLVSGAPGPFTIPCNLSVSESEAARR